MSVRFRNPWIDPRVVDVRPVDVQAYLHDRGWEEARGEMPGVKRFLSAPRDDGRIAVLVPETTDDGPSLNLLVECVGKVAAWEGRFAGDVLSDLLQTAMPAAINGHPVKK